MTDTILYIHNALRNVYPVQEINAFVKVIIGYVCHLSNYKLLLGKEREVTPEERKEIESIVERLKKYEPIQYILGLTEFYGYVYKVNPSVLIPRPETEELVERVVNDYKGQAPTILDIGSGSGCIAISLALYLPDATVSACDISDAALALSNENAVKMNVSVPFFKMDILNTEQSQSTIPFGLDVIVSNPPYVTYKEMPFVDKNVVDYEPAEALFVTDDDPLLFYRHIALLGKRKLKRGGRIYVEINSRYGEEVIAMFRKLRFKKLELIQDYSKRNRFVKVEV
jgi:release factor glutamine methyltransferase